MPQDEVRTATGRQGGLAGLPGWDRLRHGGLLLDGKRLAALAPSCVPAALDAWTERQLRQRAAAMLDGSAETSQFVAFVLEQVCGLDESTGAWTRGTHVIRRPGDGARSRAKPSSPGSCGRAGAAARLPVFLDDGRRLGIGKSPPHRQPGARLAARRAASIWPS